MFNVKCDSGKKVLLETENLCVNPTAEFVDNVEKIIGKNNVHLDASSSPLKNPIKKRKWRR